MAYDPDNTVLRLPKKHAAGIADKPDPELGRNLVRAQSLRTAVVAGLIAIVVFAIAWILVTAASGRVLPWFTVLLGFALGYAVRRGGRGLDWRFPALAAFMAFAGSLLGNVVISAAYTAGEFETSTVRILARATSMTWPVFFDEVLNGADYVYALMSAGIAAFFANRRLSRRQYFALRQWQEQESGD